MTTVLSFFLWSKLEPETVLSFSGAGDSLSFVVEQGASRSRQHKIIQD